MLHQVLLGSAIDYAGLFPPASLSLEDAVRNYATYLASDDAWALGRFVVGGPHLGALGALLDQRMGDGSESRWKVTVVAGPHLGETYRQIERFNHQQCERALVDSLEYRVSTIGALEDGPDCDTDLPLRYMEIPLIDDPGPLLDQLSQAGLRPKIRTGGIVADRFPTEGQVLRFLKATVERHLPYKATAGLHHPLRGEYPLTYETESARGTMHGYLNLLCATALLLAGVAEEPVGRVLHETSSKAFRFADEGLEIHGRKLDLKSLRRARTEGLQSFGSCSFTEPVQAMGVWS